MKVNFKANIPAWTNNWRVAWELLNDVMTLSNDWPVGTFDVGIFLDETMAPYATA